MAAEVEALLDDSEIREFLNSLEEKFESIEAGAEALGGVISSVVFSDIDSHFYQQMGPEGKWQQWSDIYKEHLESIGKGGNKILQYNGRLRQSFLPSNYRVDKGGVIFYNPAKTKDGFPYAVAHNEGGEKLPQREFMWLSDAGNEAIAQQVLDWIVDVG